MSSLERKDSSSSIGGTHVTPSIFARHSNSLMSDGGGSTGSADPGKGISHVQRDHSTSWFGAGDGTPCTKDPIHKIISSVAVSSASPSKSHNSNAQQVESEAPMRALLTEPFVRSRVSPSTRQPSLITSTTSSRPTVPDVCSQHCSGGSGGSGGGSGSSGGGSGSSSSNGSNNGSNGSGSGVGNAAVGDSPQQGAQRRNTAVHPECITSREQVTLGQLARGDDVLRVPDPRKKDEAGESAEQRLPLLASTSPAVKPATVLQQKYTIPPAVTTHQPHHATRVFRDSCTPDVSRAIVPYVSGGAAQLPKRQEHHFISEEQHSTSQLDPVLRRFATLPRRTHVSGASLPRDGSLEGVDSEECVAVGFSGSHSGSSTAKPSMAEGGRQRSEWVVMSAEQAERAARKLSDQTEKNEALEFTAKKHKRERVLIYDAAMKQAAKKEEEGVNEAKQTFKREQDAMRAEVDQQLHSINNLYQEHCKDYAQMVSDECEGEISKASADLRKDWARQKKTIDHLLRDGGEEDRQVQVIARAVMEQLQEERKDEVADIRADIYSDVKMEFESREVALREALESEHRADLDGIILLAEIRHQKEMDQLRIELSSGGEPLFAEAATGALVVCSGGTPRGLRAGDSGSNADPSASSPSLSRPSPKKKMRVDVSAGRTGGAGGGGRGGGGGGGGVITPSEKLGLVRKFPIFRIPIQKVSPGKDKRPAQTPSDRPASGDTPKAPIRTKKASRVGCVDSRVGKTAKRSIAKGSSNNSKAVASTVANNSKAVASTVASSKEDRELEEDITSALMVSPTKAIPGMIVTPSTDAESGSAAEPSRPKKRAKRLFSACP